MGDTENLSEEEMTTVFNSLFALHFLGHEVVSSGFGRTCPVYTVYNTAALLLDHLGPQQRNQAWF